MKKFFRAFTAILCAIPLLAFAGCGTADPPKDGTGETLPAVSPLAALDRVDLKAAFGDTETENWSFSLCSDGELGAAYTFRLLSGTNEETLYAQLGADATLHDRFGVRAASSDPEQPELFGGGEAALSMHYTGPKSDSEPKEKTFAAGFVHDGDFLVYANEDGSEGRVALSSLAENLAAASELKTFSRLGEAVACIPENAKNGLTLRLCVEKLIDLGFTAEIDETDGVTVRLTATAGFYTDLLNDMLEQFLPEDWLPYIPRADFRYNSTEFDISLSFGENGLFRSYSVASDVDLTLSLAVRGLFTCESGIKLAGSGEIFALSLIPS